MIGVGAASRAISGPAFPHQCPNCNNLTFFHYMTVKVWFTLFFIPVLPYKIVHAFVCSICERGTPIKGAAETAKAKRMCELTSSWNNKQLDDEQYHAALDAAV